MARTVKATSRAAARVDANLAHVPRPYQRPFWQFMTAAPGPWDKRACLEWHRRSGKDLTAWNFTFTQAVQTIGTYYYFFPTYRQGKKVLWDGRDGTGRMFRDYIPAALKLDENETEMQIVLRHPTTGGTGSVIQIIGADNIDSIVGTNPIGCVFSEYSLIPERAYDYVRPILRENHGWAVFIFTPRGDNHATRLYEQLKGQENAFCQTLTVSDTLLENGAHAVPPEDVQKERAEGMPEELVQQEFYCSRSGSTEGAFFTDALQQARIGVEPHDPARLVHTGWDLGLHDPMAVWFFQFSVSGVPRLIEYMGWRPGVGKQPHAKSLKDWITELREIGKIRGYAYGSHLAPHDIDTRELTTGQSRREFAAGLGWDFTVVPKVGKKIDAIEAARRLIVKGSFDEVRCEDGLAALRAYRRKWDDDSKCFSDQPIHDWSSNGADAFQQIALGLELVVDEPDLIKQTEADTDFSGYEDD